MYRWEQWDRIFEITMVLDIWSLYVRAAGSLTPPNPAYNISKLFWEVFPNDLWWFDWDFNSKDKKHLVTHSERYIMVKISRSWCHRSNMATEEVGTDSLQWGKADF